MREKGGKGRQRKSAEGAGAHEREVRSAKRSCRAATTQRAVLSDTHQHIHNHTSAGPTTETAVQNHTDRTLKDTKHHGQGNQVREGRRGLQEGELL